MLVIWKERARPRRARCAAGSAVTSSPAKRIRPESGRRLPASWLMKVVLPAPLGPMTAWVSPSSTSRSTPSVARSATKLLYRPSTSRRLFSIPAREYSGEAALEEDHRQHEQRTEDHLPVLGPALQQLLDEQQREGAEHRARRARHAAEDHHEHQLARLLPAHEAGRKVAGVVRVERARDAAHGAGDDEGGEAVRIGREPERPRARLVRLARPQHHPEPRIHDFVD